MQHCGEWLDKSRAPATQSPLHAQQRPNYSMYRVYEYAIRGSNQQYEFRRLLALDPEHAKSEALRTLPGGYALDDGRGLSMLPFGRFNCPNCGSRHTDCHRDVGCMVLIIIFVSIGLGLIAIPFLPFKCSCNACGNAWKT